MRLLAQAGRRAAGSMAPMHHPIRDRLQDRPARRRRQARQPSPASSRLRRMLPKGMESPAQIHQGRAIQVQSRHGGPARGGSPLDPQETGAPGKMAQPTLPARVEQGNRTPSLRIGRVRLGVFVTVARRARPGQLSRRAARTPHPWNDVLADEGGAGETGGMPAVLAAVAGAVAHLSPDCPRNSLMRHPCGLRSSSACTACTAWPRRRANSASASARAASSRWACWARDW